jgi:caa(3)-type oxidase subunit IV
MTDDATTTGTPTSGTPATGTGVIEPGAEIVPAGEGEVVARAEQLPAVAEHDHAHPGPKQYVYIAVILVVITAIEVALSYLDGDINSNLLIFFLAFAAAIKFFLVCSWYMHMKQDSSFFRRTFMVGLVGATIVYSIALATFASTVLNS